MKRKITLVLNLCLAMSLMAQPKFGTGPAGVGNAKGDNGQLPNSMWFKADKEKYFTLEGDNSTIKNWHDASGNGNSLIAKIGKPANYTATLKGAPSLTKDSWGAYTVNFGTTGDASRSLYIDDLASEKTQIEGNNGLYLCAVAKRNYVPTSNTTEEFKAIIEKRFEQDPYTNRSYVFQFDGGSGNFNEIQITLNYGTTYTYFSNERKITSLDSFNILSMNYDGSMVYAKTNYDNQPGSFTPFTQTINNSVSPLVIARDGAMTISEIIIMNKGLNAAQEKIINNYLSRKHKIGLYFNGYINNDNFPYNGDIIGVGRGSSSAYHLRSSGGGLGIEADSTSLSSTNSFIFAAHNNLDSVKIKNDFINRFYYIHSQEATGDKVIKGSLFFLFDSLGLTVPTAADGYKLYYSPSGSAEFTGDTVASTPTLVGNTIKFTLDTIKTGYYALGKATKPIGLSVKNVKESGKFNATIYPNPVQSQLNVELNTDVNSSFMLNVYNIYGSKLISKTEPWNINLAMVNVTELPKGIYLLEIIQGETKKTLRFVKQ